MADRRTVEDLLKRYPGGFAVGPGGRVSRTIAATTYFYHLAGQHPFPPPNGGYLVVEMVEEDREDNDAE